MKLLCALFSLYCPPPEATVYFCFEPDDTLTVAELVYVLKHVGRIDLPINVDKDKINELKPEKFFRATNESTCRK